MDWGTPFDTVPVPRRLLREVLADGTCPLHIRMKLQKAMQRHRPQQVPYPPRLNTASVESRHICSQAEEASPCCAVAPPRERRVESDAEAEATPLSTEEPEQSLAEDGCSPEGIQQQMLEEAPADQVAAAAAAASTAAGTLMLERLSVPPVPPQMAESAQELSAHCPPIVASHQRAGSAESAAPAQDLDEQTELPEQPFEECVVRRSEETEGAAATSLAAALVDEEVEEQEHTTPAERGGGEEEAPGEGLSPPRQAESGAAEEPTPSSPTSGPCAEESRPGKLSDPDVVELEKEGVLFGAEGSSCPDTLKKSRGATGAILAEIPAHFMGLAIHVRLGPCVALIAESLALAEVLAMRACSLAALDWVMQRTSSQLVHDDGCEEGIAGHMYAADGAGPLAVASVATDLGALPKVHDRIRTRLWIQRVAELNRDNSDETTFETQVRSFANDALRRRMEAEMAEAKRDMERQIHAFQAEVDRRMEEQAHRVHAIVEERVQQQLDGILATEMEKVRALVEERVQNKVRAVVQREVQTTVCEMQVRLAVLARENDRLRTAFLEHLDHSDLCYRSLVWALSPNATGFFARTLRVVWYCQRRFTKFSAWLLGVPPDRRRERLRTRLEALRRTAGGAPSESDGPNADGLAQDAVTGEASRDLWGRELEDARRQLLAPAAAAAAVAGEALGIAGGSRSFLPAGGLDGAGTLEQPLLAMALRIAAGEGAFRRAAATISADTAGEERDEGIVPRTLSGGADMEARAPADLPEASAGSAAGDAAPAAGASTEEVVALASDAAEAEAAPGAVNGAADVQQAAALGGDELDVPAEVAVAAAAAAEEGGASAPLADGGERSSARLISDPVSSMDSPGASVAAGDSAPAAGAADGNVPLEDGTDGGEQDERPFRSGEVLSDDDGEFEEPLDPSEFAAVQPHAEERHVPDAVGLLLSGANVDDDSFEDALAELPQPTQERLLDASEGTESRTGQEE